MQLITMTISDNSKTREEMSSYVTKIWMDFWQICDR